MPFKHETSPPAPAQSLSGVQLRALVFGSSKDVAEHAGAVGRPTALEREPPHEFAAPDPPALTPPELSPPAPELPAAPAPPTSLLPAVAPTSLLASPPQCIAPTRATDTAKVSVEAEIEG